MSYLSKWSAVLLLLALHAWAQSNFSSRSITQMTDTDLPNAPDTLLTGSPREPGIDSENRLLTPFMKHLASDQRQFWTSPAKWSRRDAKTLLPFAAFTGALLGSDGWISKQISTDPRQLQLSRDLSNYAVYSFVGASGSAFLLGQMTNNDHLSETGLLSGESALNSTAVAYVLKGVTQRARPDTGQGGWAFWKGGSSFPSEHAAIAWSMASVIAHEYPGPLTKLFAYGLASSVTVARVTSNQHFASDALIGSVLGWYMGRQIYREHHDSELRSAAWGDFTFNKDDGTKLRFRASPYVPLDSWIYPALERLSALGYVDSAYLNQKPWTRLECARLVEEAGQRIPQADESRHPIAQSLAELSLEFAPETRRLEGEQGSAIALDSIYTRITGISGSPLRDSFHFAQTLANDFGRPYAAGFNLISGASAMATVGPLAFYARGEYQQAPAAVPYSNPVLQAISQADGKPVTANNASPVGRVELLESQAAIGVGNLQVTFGKQSAWLGPSRSGSLLLSDNAAPFVMLRLETVSPYRVPLLSQILGPLKTEFFVGELTGHSWINNGSSFYGPVIRPQPFVHGDRISFKPTKNLQVGMGIVVLFGGPGLPFTWHNFLRTYYAHNASTANNPGKRFSAFDFTYRIPGLRKWVTAYLDSLVVDEVSPILSTRPSLNPGLYFPQIPKFHNLEFRVEGLKTQQAPHVQFAPGYVYSDRRYRNGYTNGGDILLGNAIGRAGVGIQSWATYHLSPRNSVELSYRHVNVDHSFLEGGHLNDFGVSTNWMVRRSLGISSAIQYEQWGFPVLSTSAQRNLSVSLQITYWPKSIAALAQAKPQPTSRQ